jgi:hypothetical protein
VPIQHLETLKLWKRNVGEFIVKVNATIEMPGTSGEDFRLILIFLFASFTKSNFSATAENLSSLRNMLGLSGDPVNRDKAYTNDLLNEISGDTKDNHGGEAVNE